MAPSCLRPHPSVPRSSPFPCPHHQCLENPANPGKDGGNAADMGRDKQGTSLSPGSAVSGSVVASLAGLELPVPIPGVFYPKSSHFPLCDHLWGKTPDFCSVVIPPAFPMFSPAFLRLPRGWQPLAPLGSAGHLHFALPAPVPGIAAGPEPSSRPLFSPVPAGFGSPGSPSLKSGEMRGLLTGAPLGSGWGNRESGIGWVWGLWILSEP